MGEAFLMGNSGGLRFRGLLVLSPPVKTTYVITGSSADNVDATGLSIGADLGQDVLPLPPDKYTVSPAAVTPELTAITVTATIGTVTRSVRIPIVVYELDADLEGNSWAAIAAAAASGKASQAWSIGDIKSETVAGATRRFRIIGFDHDPLSECDDMYSNRTYNAAAYDSTGIRYAGITFQAVESFGDDASMLTAATQNDTGGWATTKMRTETMASDFASLPADMAAVIKTVDKYSAARSAGTLYAAKTEDKFFLLSCYEMYSSAFNHRDGDGNGVPDVTDADIEEGYCSQYSWYIPGSRYVARDDAVDTSGLDADADVLRSPYHFSGAGTQYQANVSYANEVRRSFVTPTGTVNRYPAFCV